MVVLLRVCPLQLLTQVEVGRDAVFECKVNNLGDYKVVDTHNDQRRWWVVGGDVGDVDIEDDDDVDDNHGLHHR